MNHQAIIAVVTETITIPGADKIHIARVLGENCIVSKDIQEGFIGVLFPADLQLSEEFCYENNLNRHSTENKDNTKSGFFEASRRVRVQPFLKCKSSGLFVGVSSLEYAGGVAGKPLGFSFEELNGHKICQKYVSEATKKAIGNVSRPKQAKKDFAPLFAKHVESAQFKHNVGLIPKGALLSFHAKIHGTSHRSGLTKVSVALPKWKQVVNKYLSVFPTSAWDFVVGTRNVVLTSKGRDGYHGPEQFRFDVAENLKPYMEKGMTVYGEIAGYANGKPIMAVHAAKSTKDKAFQKKYGEQVVYKYGCAEYQYRFHIYRITYTTEDGKGVDFSQKQLEQWCKDRNFLAPYEVAPQEVYDGDVEKLMSKVEALTERTDVLSEDYIDSSHPTEGVIIRVDSGNLTPTFLKSKAYYFRTMEGLCEAADIEDAS